MAKGAPLKRHYVISFSVYDRRKGTISINQTTLTLNGAWNMRAIDTVTERAGQEWYLNQMGVLEPPTDPAKPMDDYQVMLTGYMLLEVDENGQPYPYMIGD